MKYVSCWALHKYIVFSNNWERWKAEKIENVGVQIFVIDKSGIKEERTGYYTCSEKRKKNESTSREYDRSTGNPAEMRSRGFVVKTRVLVK